MSQAQWYVVHTYSGYENSVKAAIEKSIANRGLQDSILEVSIPMETVHEMTETGPKTVERKVFPGYVLVKMEMNHTTWHIVRNIRGVTGFLGEGNDPIPLSDADVQALGVERNEIVVNFQVGDTVRITEGTMQNYCGVVEDLDLERDRVKIVIQASNRMIQCELSLSQVEACD